jgi:hypothetical protein
VHGDHGSRVLQGGAEQFPEDWLQTFIAVKSPATTPSVVSEKTNLQEEFARQFERAFVPR